MKEILNNKKVRYGIVIALGVLTGFIISWIINYEPEVVVEEEIVTIGSTEELGEILFDLYVDVDATEQDLLDIFYYQEEGTEMTIANAPFGEYGVFVYRLTDDEIEEYGLEEYKDACDEYLSNLSETIKESITYEASEVDVVEEGYLQYETYEFSSFLYYLYQVDFEMIFKNLVDNYYEYENVIYDEDYLETLDVDEYKIVTYKAMVKTLEILNGRLEEYANEETATIDITFFNDAFVYTEEEDAVYEYDWKVLNITEVFNVLNGYNYENIPDVNDADRVLDLFSFAYKVYIGADDALVLGENGSNN